MSCHPSRCPGLVASVEEQYYLVQMVLDHERKLRDLMEQLQVEKRGRLLVQEYTSILQEQLAVLREEHHKFLDQHWQLRRDYDALQRQLNHLEEEVFFVS